MAKMKTNNGGGGDKNTVATKDYKKVYTKEQIQQMGAKHGDDPRNFAAEIKRDIGNDKLPRARYGTAGHQAAVQQSNANTAKKMAENNPTVKKKVVYKGSK